MEVQHGAKPQVCTKARIGCGVREVPKALEAEMSQNCIVLCLWCQAVVAPTRVPFLAPWSSRHDQSSLEARIDTYPLSFFVDLKSPAYSVNLHGNQKTWEPPLVDPGFL